MEAKHILQAVADKQKMASTSDFMLKLISKLQGKSHGLDKVIDNLLYPSTSAEKVRSCLQFLKDQNVLPSESLFVNEKIESLAVEEKQEGNEYFALKNYPKALEHYNRSLCFSPTGSENLSIVYANRSAIYFNTGHYEACMENIELAESHGYPDKLKPKLIKRKDDCLALMNNNREKKTTLHENGDVKLSYESNTKVPCLVNGIKLVTSEKYGRHLVATQNFNPGDILFVEEPFCPTLSKDVVVFYCLYCMKSNLMNLKPCTESTSAMFCSKKCYDDAMEQFFKYEAPILSGSYNVSETGKQMIIEIRLLLKAFCLFENVNNLKAFIEKIPLGKLSAFDVDYSNADQKDLFRIFYASQSDVPLPNSLNLYFMTAAAYHILMTHTDLKKFFTSKQDEDFLMNVLYHIYCVHSIGANTLYGPIPTKKWNGFCDKKGDAVFSITSLLNHSCAPNVRTTGVDKNIVFVMRPIKSGEQLFAAYDSFFWSATRAERHEHLMNHHGFECDCIACENNYPTVSMPDGFPPQFIVPKLADVLVNDMEKLKADKWKDLDLAKKLLMKVNELLKVYSKNLKSLEYQYLQKSQFFLFETISSRPHMFPLLQ